MLQSPHQRYDIAVKELLRILGVWPWSVLNHVWCCTDIGTAIPRKMCYRVYVGTINRLKSGWYVGLGHATLPWSQAKNKQQSFHCFFLSPAIPAGSNPAGGSLREAFLQTHEFFARAVSRPWYPNLIATSCFIIKCDLFCFVCLLAA